MSLVLPQRYSTWQELGFLFLFLSIIAVASAMGVGLRPSRVVAFLSRQMRAKIDAVAFGWFYPFFFVGTGIKFNLPSLSIIVVITEIGVQAKTLNHNIAAAMVGAALLSVLLFPTIARILLSRQSPPAVAK